MEKEKKNNGTLVGLLLGVIIMLLIFICLFVTGTITFKTTTNTNEKATNNSENSNDSNEDTNTNYCDRIVGDYSFDEIIPNGGDVNGITSAVYDYKLSITNDQDYCTATLEINGFQTYNKIKLDVKYNNDKYNFMFNTYLDGDVPNTGYAGTYNKGDILFNFYNNNNELYTNWEKYTPHVEANKTDGVYFKK